MAERSGLSSRGGADLEGVRAQPHRVDYWNCPPTRTSSRSSTTLSGSTSTHPSLRWCCAWTRSPRSRPWPAAPVLPMMPGMPEKRTHDYVRHGTTSLFAALDITDGTVITALHRRHRAIEFRKFLATSTRGPRPPHVHLVCDNYATHKAPTSATWLATPPPLPPALHPDPSLDQPGRTLLRRLTTGLIQSRRAPQRAALEGDIRTWITDLERQPATVRMDQDRRADPPSTRTINKTN